MKILMITCSSRPGSNSTFLAERSTEVFSHLTQGSAERCEIERLHLPDMKIAPNTGIPVPADDYGRCVDSILKADVILFFTPVYWYNLPGSVKNFIDRLPPSPDFRAKLENKQLGMVFVSGSDPSAYSESLWKIQEMTSQRLKMHFHRGPWFVGFPPNTLASKVGEVDMKLREFASSFPLRQHLSSELLNSSSALFAGNNASAALVSPPPQPQAAAISAVPR